MNKLHVIIGLSIAIVAGALIIIFFGPSKVNAPTGQGEPTSFAECVEFGYPVAESYPRQCNTPSGLHFVEEIGNSAEKENLIVSAFPRPGSKVTSPLIATGEARGNWYFEASFPVSILDSKGKSIGQGYAEAQGEWMTEEFVPFKSIPITFTPQPAGSVGTVVLHKDNPSGLPEHDDQVFIPVTF